MPDDRRRPIAARDRIQRAADRLRARDREPGHRLPRRDARPRERDRAARRDRATPGDAAFIASHRGGGATAPENTLPAITAALAAGFDYVEVDVALTADRQPVLMHDATVDRTTDGHGRLAALTLAAGARARRRLVVRRRRSPARAVPTFARVPRRAGSAPGSARSSS